MCSITALLDRTTDLHDARQHVLKASRSFKFIGDRLVWYPRFYENAIIAHERLAIVDVMSGAQPLEDPDHGRILAVNGEIYNHTSIRDSADCRDYPLQSGSDCEVILALYREHGRQPRATPVGDVCIRAVRPESDTWMADCPRPHRHHSRFTEPTTQGACGWPRK